MSTELDIDLPVPGRVRKVVALVIGSQITVVLFGLPMQCTLKILGSSLCFTGGVETFVRTEDVR